MRDERDGEVAATAWRAVLGFGPRLNLIL